MKLWHSEPRHNHWRRAFTNSEKARFWCSMSIVIALLAWSEWVKPSLPPFHGKLSFMKSLAYDSLGLRGVFYLFAAGVVLTMYAGFRLWAQKMIVPPRTLIPILLSGILAACGDPHISQDALEAALVKQQPKFDALTAAIEKYKQVTGDYPATLGELQIKHMPSISLPAEYKSLRSAPPHYELARDKSFFRLMYAASDRDDYNIYAAASYNSYDKQWQTSWDPERFLWVEIRHYGQLYQNDHSARHLDLTAQSLLEAPLNNSAHPCRNFWHEWVVTSLGQSGAGKESYPTVRDTGEISIYPAHDSEVAYAFVTTEKTYRPMTKPLRIVTAVYRLEDKSTGWELLQVCDTSE